MEFEGFFMCLNTGSVLAFVFSEMSDQIVMGFEGLSPSCLREVFAAFLATRATRL
jgi:hypothetical protein